jgi:hypothetical protein
MKKFVAVILVVISFSAFAQVDTAKASFSKRYTKFSKDRIAIDLNGTNWIHKIPGLNIKWYSRGINIYFNYDFQIKKSFFSIAPGIGVSCSNIYHRSEMTDSTGPGIQFKPLANPDNYKVNKLSLTYIDIPIEFRFRTKPDRLDNSWKFVAGFKAGIRVDGHTKTSTKTPKEIVKLKPFPDLNLFHAGPFIRIGYSSFNLTAYYGILGVFKNNRGPQANEFSVGISFNGL